MKTKEISYFAYRTGCWRHWRGAVCEASADYVASGKEPATPVSLDFTLNRVRDVFQTRRSILKELSVLDGKIVRLQSCSDELRSRLARLDGILLEVSDLLADAE